MYYYFTDKCDNHQLNSVKLNTRGRFIASPPWRHPNLISYRRNQKYPIIVATLYYYVKRRTPLRVVKSRERGRSTLSSPPSNLPSGYFNLQRSCGGRSIASGWSRARWKRDVTRVQYRPRCRRWNSEEREREKKIPPTLPTGSNVSTIIIA